MIESYVSGLSATVWVVVFRWFYVLVLFVGWASGVFTPPVAPLAVTLFFIFVFLLNIFSHLHLTWLKRNESIRQLQASKIFQFSVDFIIFSLIIFFSGGVSSLYLATFFLLIIYSILLFEFWGVLLIAVLSSGVINLLSFLQARALEPPILITTAVYLIGGLLASYVSDIIRRKGRELRDQILGDQDHVKRLEDVNQKLEEFSRRLLAKETELSSANRRLTDLDRAKSEFISVTTHQLRTPLSAIKWTFNLLVKEEFGAINADQKDLLQKGYESTDRMIKLVNDILNINRIESAGQGEYHFQPLQPEEMLAEVVAQFSGPAESQGVNLIFNPPAKLVPKIKADAGKLRMVVENLVDNAVKYTRRGGRVTVSVDDRDVNRARGMLEFQVADTGVGIPEDQKQYVFKKFFRGRNALKMEPDGTGLGLSIVNDIVGKHGGTIWFESRENEGTTFHFTLPLHRG